MKTSHQSQVAERYDVLLRGLERDGRIDVAEVAPRLGVTQETIRRDLRALEIDGKLQRVYGGAVPVEVAHPGTLTPPGTTVSGDHLEFGAWVWSQLPRTGTIMLGAGPLAAAVATAATNQPPDPPGLTVVTTSLDAAVVLSRGAPTLAVYLVGGMVSRRTGGQEGQWALDELGRFTVDIAVVSACGVDVDHGLSTDTTAAAAVDAALVAAARRVVALAPASAVGRSAFVHVAGMDKVDLIAVHGQPPAPSLQPFVERQIDLRVIG